MDIKLNQFLQPENSPIAQNQGVVDSYKFFAEHERSSVDQSRIRNFNFSQGYGGTITLGGTANGAGELRILDQNGNLIVLGDTSGLTIYDGNLLVKNDNNTTIIDTTGIVSEANFQKGNAFDGAAGLSTTSSSYIDVTGSNAGTIITDRNIYVLFAFMGYGYNNGAITSNGASQLELSIYDTGLSAGITDLFAPGLTTTHAYTVGPDLFIDQTVNSQMYARTTVLAVAAGTHSYKLRYKAVNGGTAVLDAWELNFVALGS